MAALQHRCIEGSDRFGRVDGGCPSDDKKLRRGVAPMSVPYKSAVARGDDFVFEGFPVFPTPADSICAMQGAGAYVPRRFQLVAI